MKCRAAISLLVAILGMCAITGTGLEAQIYIPQTPVKPGPPPAKDNGKQPIGDRIPEDRVRPNTRKDTRLSSRKESLNKPVGPSSTFGERTQGFMGFTLEILPIQQGSLSVFPTTPIIFGIMGGAYHNIKHWNDMFAIGLDLSTTLTFSYNSLSGLTFYNKTPLYFVARVGARATKFNDSRVGAMLGIGGGFNYLVLPYATQGSNGTVLVSRLEQAYFVPSAMFEVTVNQNTNNVWAVRIHANLIPYVRSNFQPVGLSSASDVSYQNFGIGLTYYF